MIEFQKERPEDYHCHCEYCENLFGGEIKKKDGSYYSARKREGYSTIEKEQKHLDKGHWQGYQFVIENYTKEKDVVFDPMVGSGTAIVEAMKLNRTGWGIELEYFNILKANCENYPGQFWIEEGDCREKIDEFPDRLMDLIVTGPVYNNNSDAPERKKIKGEDHSFNYTDKLKNLAFLKDKDYFDELDTLYGKCISKLKKDGVFSIIIKDPIRKKQPYLLHYEIASRLEKLGLKVEKVFIHKHYPLTLSLNTYHKRFPEVAVPYYQTIVILRKI